MGWSSVCKLLQKRSFDLLSQRNGTLIILASCLLIVLSGFQFGEALLEWSSEKYAAVFNSFSDNVAGTSFRNRLCLPVPIDVVYTWVNGSDPELLRQLSMYKMQAEKLFNYTDSAGSECKFAHCVPAVVVVLEPALPTSLTLSSLSVLYPSFRAATRLTHHGHPTKNGTNVTVLAFDSHEQVVAALKENVLHSGHNVSIREAYYTSEWALPNALLVYDAVLMSGFPHTLSQDELKAKLPDKLQKIITKMVLHTDRGVAVLSVDKKEDYEAFLGDVNVTLEGKAVSFSGANFLWDLHDYSKNEDISLSRFEDNEELRYSLRSIERFAPWVRHVFIVTNGQIPYWLNLDSSRLTIVTHQELYPNKSHLPTFSSPSIESHLHAIPGLSDKFIYLNDDVIFGKPVWPDDFYTHAHGQKVYLTWPVPNCQEGCPSTWIRDGYCDKACNNTECEWDGGDCTGNRAQAGFGYQAGGNSLWGASDTDSFYCNSGCANNWIADKYCDTACNMKQCGFDAGDCATGDYDKLHAITLSRNTTEYTLPQGEYVMYFNLSTLVSAGGTIEEGTYNESSVFRAVSVAQKFQVLTVVLHKNKTRELLHFGLKLKRGDKMTRYNFTLLVNTVEPIKNLTIPKPETPHGAAPNVSAATNKTEKPVFSDIPEHLRRPKVISMAIPTPDVPMETVGNMSLYEMPADLDGRWSRLLAQIKHEEISEKWFALQRADLWSEYQAGLKVDGKDPVLKKITTLKPVAKHHKKNLKDLAMMLDGGVESPIEVRPGAEELQKIVEHSVEKIDVADEGGVLGIGDVELQKQMADKDGKKTFDAYLQEKKNMLKQPDQQQQQEQQQQEQQKEKLGDIQLKQQQQNGDEPPPEDAGVQEKVGAVDEGERLRHRDPEAVEPANQAPPGDDRPKPHGRRLQAIDADFLHEENINPGFLPWEKSTMFKELQKAEMRKHSAESYDTGSLPGRHLMDTFGDSLRHVNKLFNKAYGYTARKVPAHMPHMVDKHIMADLYAKFEHDWDVTSSHRIRSSDDMQYAFSYFYFLMSEPSNLTVWDVFSEFDVDKSGVLSDREIRTLATRLYDLPLDLVTLTTMETTFTNCSKHMEADPLRGITQMEKYYDKSMPQVTYHLVVSCDPVIKLFAKAFKDRTAYKHETVGEEEIAFKMIRTNVSHVVGQLDDIRKHPKKFICLNDNIDHSREEAKTVKAVLVDFYESLFPSPSIFELPREYRNRFLNIDELREWRRYRDWLKLWTQVALFFLVAFTIASFFSDKIESLQRRFLGRRRGSGDGSTPAPAPSPVQTV